MALKALCNVNVENSQIASGAAQNVFSGRVFEALLKINHFFHSDSGQYINIQSLFCFNLGSPNVFLSLKIGTTYVPF